MDSPLHPHLMGVHLRFAACLPSCFSFDLFFKSQLQFPFPPSLLVPSPTFSSPPVSIFSSSIALQKRAALPHTSAIHGIVIKYSLPNPGVQKFATRTCLLSNLMYCFHLSSLSFCCCCFKVDITSAWEYLKAGKH